MRSTARSLLPRMRPWFLPVVSFALATHATTPACAWGPKGHRVAGAVADSRLTPAARAAVEELLAGDHAFPERTLAEISDWADQEGHRAYPRSAPWHYVNVPISGPGYRDADCDEKQGCVISKIREWRAVLGDRSAPRSRRRDALLFFVHLMEDLHQPFHVGDDHDRGATRVQVRFVGSDRTTNLHKVWDSDLIELAHRSDSSWIRRLNELADAPENRGWTRGTLVDWANESWEIARQAHSQPRGGKKIESGAYLGDAYAEFALPIVERRLAQAGVRLAHELNQIFP